MGDSGIVILLYDMMVFPLYLQCVCSDGRALCGVGEMGTLVRWAGDLIATMVIFIYGSRSVEDCQVGLVVACGGTVNKERS
jgi:hypothetical protein